MLRGILVRAFVYLGAPIAVLQPFYGILLYLFYTHSEMPAFVWAGWGFYNGGIILALATLLGYLVFELQRSPIRLKA